MADNTLTALIPKILARGLRVLREQCTLARTVNLDYAREAKEYGDTIDVPLPTAVSTAAVSPANTPPATTALTPSTVQIPLDNWKYAAFKLSHKDLAEIDANAAFVPHSVAESIKALANDINESIHATYKGIYGYVGDATFGNTNVDPFASTAAAAINARKTLSQQLCPQENRRLVLDFDAEANALALSVLADLEKTGDRAVKIEGELGRKYGFDWFTDDHVTTHTAGTAAADTDTIAVDLVAGYSIGDESVVLDVSAGTSTLVVGDIIKFAGHSQTYTVTANATLDTAGVAVSISPPLVAAVANDEEVEVATDHTVNLAYHRDAFALAIRPLADGLPGYDFGNPNNSFAMSDPLTGIPLRLTVSQEHYQIVWRFDVLWGVKLVRPELACRVAGAV